MEERESAWEEIGYRSIVRAPRVITIDPLPDVDLSMSVGESRAAARKKLEELKAKDIAGNTDWQDTTSRRGSQTAA